MVRRPILVNPPLLSCLSEAFEKGGGVTRVGKFGTTNVYGTKMIIKHKG